MIRRWLTGLLVDLASTAFAADLPSSSGTWQPDRAASTNSKDLKIAVIV